MGRRMHLWQYGHYGPPLLVFPSAAGMAHEWEAHGMVEALEDWLEGGQLKLYCVESNVAEAWTRKDSDPNWRIERHQAYERFLIDELVPFIREDCRTPDIGIGATGTSLGALYSLNACLKYPGAFTWALCLSGRYDIRWMTDGFYNHEVYLSNPLDYVRNLEGERLDAIRRDVHVTLVCGQGRWEDGNIEDTQRMAEELSQKRIPHVLDLWGHDVDHQWPWWMKQARHHLQKRLDV
jgi:esterase/lipase superfamily enzyme